MPSLTSQLIVRMIDQVTGPAKSAGSSVGELGGKFKSLDKISSGGGAFRKLGEITRQVAKEMEALDRIGDFKTARRGLTEASQAFKRAQQDVRKLASEMAAVEAPTRKMEASYQRLVRVADRAKQAFLEQGGVVRTATSALSAAGVSVDRLASAEARLKGSVNATTEAMKKQAVIAGKRQDRKEAFQTVAQGAGAYASYKVARGVSATAHTYREFDKESRATKAFGNFNDAEMKAIIDMAIHKSAGTRFNDIQWLEGAKELGARGVKAPSIQGILPEAANLGQAMDINLPESVKLMEGALFSFRRDISTMEKARAEARRSADMQVAAAKASGMNADDIKQLYKFGAVGSSMSKIHEAALLAFGGLGKKVNIGGDEMGVAFREMASKLFTPTRKGREAMAAYGIDYSKYQTMPEKLNTGNFERMISQQYGVKLDARSRGKVDQIFADKSVTGDATRFAVEIGKALEGQLGIKNAQDRNRVVGSAERFRQNSARDIDSTKLMMDIMESIKGGNLKLANEIFGSKQGTRISAALGDPKLWAEMIAKIKGATDGQAENIGKERMAGFDGAVHRFNNSIKNLETAFGRAVDNDGKGGVITGAVNSVAGIIQGFAELSKESHLAAGALAVAGGAATAISSTFGLINRLFGDNGPALALTGSAVALGKSAAALNLAAARLGTGGGFPGIPGKDGKPAAKGAVRTAIGTAVAAGSRALPVTAVITGIVTAPGVIKVSQDKLLESVPGADRDEKLKNLKGHRRANRDAARMIERDESLKRAGHNPYAAEEERNRERLSRMAPPPLPSTKSARDRVTSQALQMVRRDEEAKRRGRNPHAGEDARNSARLDQRKHEIEIKPVVDLSDVQKAEAAANGTGHNIANALNITTKPEVDLSALAQADSLLSTIIAKISSIGTMSANVSQSLKSATRGTYADYGVSP